MAYCSGTLSGIGSSCASNAGGLRQEILVALKEDIDTITVTEGKVTAITLKNTKKFKKYITRKQASSLTSEFTIDDANGVKFCTSSLVANFARMETAKRVEIMALVNSDCVVIVNDANGLYWLLGYENTVNVTALTAQTGQSATDPNQYAVTLTDISTELPYEVDGTIVSGLVD